MTTSIHGDIGYVLSEINIGAAVRFIINESHIFTDFWKGDLSLDEDF